MPTDDCDTQSHLVHSTDVIFFATFSAASIIEGSSPSLAKGARSKIVETQIHKLTAGV